MTCHHCSPLQWVCSFFCCRNQPHWNSLRFRWLQYQLGTHIQQQFLCALPEVIRQVFVHTDTFGSLAQSLCVRSISPFPPRTRSEPLMEPKRRSQRFDLWEVFSGVGPALRKETLNFPYGYVRFDLLPVSGLADGSSHTAAVNKSTATNRSFQQDVFLPLSPPVIVSNKAACALVLPAENSLHFH